MHFSYAFLLLFGCIHGISGSLAFTGGLSLNSLVRRGPCDAACDEGIALETSCQTAANTYRCLCTAEYLNLLDACTVCWITVSRGNDAAIGLAGGTPGNSAEMVAQQAQNIRQTVLTTCAAAGYPLDGSISNPGLSNPGFEDDGDDTEFTETTSRPVVPTFSSMPVVPTLSSRTTDRLLGSATASISSPRTTVADISGDDLLSGGESGGTRRALASTNHLAAGIALLPCVLAFL